MPQQYCCARSNYYGKEKGRKVKLHCFQWNEMLANVLDWVKICIGQENNRSSSPSSPQ